MAARSEKIIQLLREGYRLESVLSGWHLSESEFADIVIAGHNSGDIVDPQWIVSGPLGERALEMARSRSTSMLHSSPGSVTPQLRA